MPTFRPGHITLGSDLTLTYAERGDAAGPPVVLLHGLSDSWPSFMPLVDAMPARWRVVALTLRGHGDSSKPRDGYGTADFAGDVVAAMDAIGIGSAAIVGHSMGSLVAQRIAMDRPERVSRLVLIGAFATLAGNAAVEELWNDVIAGMRDPIDEAFVRAFQRSALTMPVAPDFFQSVVAESLKLPARVWSSVLGALRSEDHTARLGEIEAPTLILWGDRDAFADRGEQAQLAERIPNARLVTYAGVGHTPHWECPGLVARDLTDFLGLRSAVAA